jgi:ATP:ADP antiporter, AAA family
VHDLQVFARSSKFSLFDPAKEMVFIEMSKEEKSKGKAVVDLVGSQIGKSGASWITQVSLMVMLLNL